MLGRFGNEALGRSGIHGRTPQSVLSDPKSHTATSALITPSMVLGNPSSQMPLSWWKTLLIVQLSVLELHQIGGVCGGTGGGGDGVGESGVGGGGVLGEDGESGGGCIGGDGGAGGIRVICTLKMSVYCCDKSSMIQGCSRSAGTHGVREVSVHSAKGFVLPGISVVSNPPDARTREATASTMLDAGGIGGGDG